MLNLPKPTSPLQSYRRAKVGRPTAVTTVNDTEVDPHSVGLMRDDIEAVWNAVVRYYRLRLQPAMTLCIRYRGQVVIDRSIGYARGAGPDDPSDAERTLARPDTLFSLFSASKVVTGILTHTLLDEGLIDIDTPVAEYVPGFGQHGKDQVTLRHVLAHQAGLARTPKESVNLENLHDFRLVEKALIDAPIQTPPGEQVAYHALTGCFILQAVLQNVTGKDLRTLLDERIRGPLGLNHFTYGVRPDLVDQVAHECMTGPPPTEPFSGWMKEALGIPLTEAVSMSNDPRYLTGVMPAANVVSTANEVSLFFECLLRGGSLNGQQIISRRALARALVPQNSGLVPDGTIKIPVRYGLGFMLGGKVISLFGPDTESAFGHLGLTNVLAWADPERDISVAFLNNGNPLIAPEMVAWMAVPRTIGQRFPRQRS